jgi:hypothetical protein
MRLFLKHLLRGLALPAVPLVLIAGVGCDTSAETASDADASAPEVQPIARPYTVFVPNMSQPPAVPNRDDGPAAFPLTVTLTPRERAAQSLEYFMPILAAYPDLAATLASGELVSAADDLAPLPASIQALAGAPWLMHEGRIVLATRERDAFDPTDPTDPIGLNVANPAGVDFDRIGLGQSAALTDAGGFFAARSALRLDAVPAAQRALVGRTVRVFDAHGERCVARVTGLVLESQLMHMAGEEYDEDDQPRAPHYNAADVIAAGQPFLLGTLEPIIGTVADCQSGFWASPIAERPPEHPHVQLFNEAPADRALVRQAVRAFRALPEWRARQHDYRHFFAGPFCFEVKIGHN